LPVCLEQPVAVPEGKPAITRLIRFLDYNRDWSSSVALDALGAMYLEHRLVWFTFIVNA
jgi:hypothetical protein